MANTISIDQSVLTTWHGFNLYHVGFVLMQLRAAWTQSRDTSLYGRVYDMQPYTWLDLTTVIWRGCEEQELVLSLMSGQGVEVWRQVQRTRVPQSPQLLKTPSKHRHLHSLSWTWESLLWRQEMEMFPALPQRKHHLTRKQHTPESIQRFFKNIYFFSPSNHF